MDLQLAAEDARRDAIIDKHSPNAEEDHHPYPAAVRQDAQRDDVEQLVNLVGKNAAEELLFDLA